MWAGPGELSIGRVLQAWRHAKTGGEEWEGLVGVMMLPESRLFTAGDPGSHERVWHQRFCRDLWDHCQGELST